jgi:copper resistance protein C
MKKLVLVAVVCAACALASAAAKAHALLDHAQPVVGSTVAAPPSQLRIWFTEALEPAFSTIAVTDAQGHEMGRGKAKLDPANPQLLVLDLAPLAPGTYHVVWRVIAIDTHVTHGDFEFTVQK